MPVPSSLSPPTAVQWRAYNESVALLRVDVASDPLGDWMEERARQPDPFDTIWSALHSSPAQLASHDVSGRGHFVPCSLRLDDDLPLSLNASSSQLALVARASVDLPPGVSPSPERLAAFAELDDLLAAECHARLLMTAVALPLVRVPVLSALLPPSDKLAALIAIESCVEWFVSGSGGVTDVTLA